MTITNGYCTLAELKASVVANATTTDATRDAIMEAVIEAASRAIDRRTGRRFFADSADVTRYYNAWDEYTVYPEDLISITTLSTDDGTRAYATTITSSEYELWPYNATLLQPEQEPYQRISLIPHTLSNTFYTGDRGVKIVGKFGWPAVPKPIYMACLLQSHRYYSRLKTPLGVSASGALGEIKVEIPALDSDITRTIAHYISWGMTP